MNCGEQADTRSIVVVGVGNEFRGDDAAGILVARQIRSIPRSGVRVAEHQGEGTSLIDLWTAEDVVVLIDAVSSARPAGTVFRILLTGNSLNTISFRNSTHSVTLAEAVELSRLLGSLPRKLIFYGIEGEEYSAGTQLSAPVKHAIPRAAKAILREIDELQSREIEEHNHA